MHLNTVIITSVPWNPRHTAGDGSQTQLVNSFGERSPRHEGKNDGDDASIVLVVVCAVRVAKHNNQLRTRDSGQYTQLQKQQCRNVYYT